MNTSNTDNQNVVDSQEMEVQSWLEKFITYFKQLLHVSSKHTGDDLNQELIEKGETPEEKRMIAEICDEIDGFHESRKKLVAAQKEDVELGEGEWLENEIVSDIDRTFQEKEGRKLTQEEEKEIRQRINDGYDNEIIRQSDFLQKESEMLEVMVEQNNDEEDKA